MSVAADRVRRSHAQARTTLAGALGFIGAALVSGAAGGSRWLVVHLFLAGGVVLAISGVSQMLTVTWSAAPAPGEAVVWVQRVCVAAGAATVAAGRQARWPDAVVVAGAATHLVGLGLLGVVLVATARRGSQRRFDAAVAGYVAAVAAGCAGVGLGAWMVAGSPPVGTRHAHVVANLLGLVGLTVGATMPFFAATVGRTRMAPQAVPRRLVATTGGLAGALAVAVVALGVGSDEVAAVALAAYAAGVVAVLGVLPRPARRQLAWAGPRLVALWAGGAWWAAAVVATAVDVAAGRAPLAGRWLGVLVVAGYAQVLWGSLAYLLPMLREGGPERLSQGFATTRSWPGLVAANAAGVGLALGAGGAVVAGAVAAWALDGAWRVGKVGLRRQDRPAA